jgi:hypothetical protein
VRKDSVMLPRPSTLAAGDHRRRIWPVKPAPPSLTTAKGLGLKESKAQGAVCKAKTQMNSAYRDPVLFLLQTLKFHSNSRKNQKNTN